MHRLLAYVARRGMAPLLHEQRPLELRAIKSEFMLEGRKEVCDIWVQTFEGGDPDEQILADVLVASAQLCFNHLKTPVVEACVRLSSFSYHILTDYYVCMNCTVSLLPGSHMQWNCGHMTT